MRQTLRFGSLVAFCAVIPLAAFAQWGMHPGFSLRGVWNPVIGSGAQYEVTRSDGSKMNVEVAIVGKENVGGQDGYWYETTLDTPAGATIIKALTVTNDQNIVVSRMIMQMANRPPMEMPSQMTKAASLKLPADIRNGSDNLGADDVTTPAGTFNTRRYRMKDGSGDVWVADKAGPYGLVKFQGKDNAMVLTKVITDARDKIAATPQPFNPMMLQKQEPQP